MLSEFPEMGKQFRAALSAQDIDAARAIVGQMLVMGALAEFDRISCRRQVSRWRLLTWRWAVKFLWRGRVAYEIYVKELSRVLDSSPAEFSAIIARLAVLFEDLRIEEAASRVPVLVDVDVIGSRYRKIYFVRRAIATLVEFGNALKMLDDRPEFKGIRKRFRNGGIKRWRDAVQFFVTNKTYLSNIRADFGGHFDHASALHGVSKMHPDTLGVLEIVKNHVARTGGVRLKFAMELVGTAMTRRRAQGQSSEEYFHEILTLVGTGFEHAVKGMHTLSAFYLLPKFGRPSS